MTESVEFIKKTTAWNEQAIRAVLQLHAEGGSVAFIARYRKDRTGNLDELAILDILDRDKKFEEISKRKLYILEAIASQGKLTAELENSIKACFDPDALEDMFVPYKQRKKTRADNAREKGLEPLAKLILAQRERNLDYAAKRYINEAVKTTDEAISGAGDIVAQWIADDAETRQMLRSRFEKHAVLSSKLSKGKEKEGEKYRDYFDYSELASRVASHRLMAVLRAEEEGILKIGIEPDLNRTLEAIDRKWIRRDSACEEILLDITKDAYKRLLLPSLENELKQKLFEKAELEAIRVFANNLTQLLLSSPLGNKRVLAIDPGIRSGCKTVCLNENGNLLYNTVLYFQTESEKVKSLAALKDFIQKYRIEAIAVGNGTAGRETSDIVRGAFKDIPVFLINEDGASVYSVSEIARKEFPDHDVTVKGAVSIGRRLIDPLAELVKIDAKSIGVGQYQHDVNQNKLKKALEETVVSCVNKVGVNLNTAGEELLSYVSGLGPVLARNILAYRNSKGDFSSREELKKVARLGDKAFEQAAGFLRVPGSAQVLDNSSVHPEQYAVVKKMANTLGIQLNALIGNTKAIESLRKMEDLKKSIGEFTFEDILKELEKPGLDPRPMLEMNTFDDRIRRIEDLKSGMIVNGVVSNITNFGAFVDLGIKENGLLHISEIGQTFIHNPSEVLALNQHLKLKVKEIDLDRKRISLTMKF